MERSLERVREEDNEIQRGRCRETEERRGKYWESKESHKEGRK